MSEIRKSKFFYGYVIVFAAWFAMLVSSAAQNSFGIFFPDLLEEFGWTRGMLSLGFTLNLWLMACFALLAGYLTERIGPRRTVIIGGIVAALGVGLLSITSQIWHFMLFYGIITPLGISMSYMIATVATVRRWFMRRAALMVAITMTGSGLGIVLFWPLAQQIINAWGWRTGYISFAIILAVGACIAGFLLRRDPESAGTYPDGIEIAEKELEAREDFLSRAEQWSVRAAFKTRSWWLLICAQFYNLAVVGLIAHIIAWGTLDLGILQGTVVLIGSLALVLAAVVGRLFGGFISDWYMSRFGVSRKPILYFSVLGVALGCLLSPSVGSATSLTLVSLIIGFSYGCAMAVFPTYLGDLFGVANLPVLFGVVAFFIAAAAGLGSMLFGFIHDATGTYDLAFFIVAPLCLVSAICLFFLKPPTRAVGSSSHSIEAPN